VPDPEKFEKIASWATDACSTYVDTSDLSASNSPGGCTREFCTEGKRRRSCNTHSYYPVLNASSRIIVLNSPSLIPIVFVCYT
jgi:hypothetical protein